ncbi:MAG: aminoglycoside phosphotransferase family protein [Alphaproteobacteria bacterium]|nr:aminoglycoside phosphotransferase family protein [Alphaproteobacteria bacterium]
MPELSELRNIVCETFPEFEIRTFSLLGKGWYASVCLANNEVVFKIPTPISDTVVGTNEKEIRILNFLEGKLDIQIPKILFHRTAKNGTHIVAMTLLPGVTYSQGLHDSYDTDTKATILTQLGQIMRQLHDAGGDPSPLTQIAHPIDSLDVFNRYLDKVRNLFSNDQIKKIMATADDYKRLSAEHPVQPVFCHSDLHFGNLMFDADAKKISGLLDFGAAHYAEPSRDMHYYWGDGAKSILSGYGDNGDEFLPRRQKFQMMVNTLNDIGEDVDAGKSPNERLENLINCLK